MKETYFFSHDYNARNDAKLQRLQMKHGMEGIGIFWCIIEMLYEEGGFISTAEYERIAFELRSHYELIESAIENFDLFIVDAEKFYSLSIIERLEKRQEKSKKAKDSALKRWESKVNANALRTQCEGNAIKDRIGKDKIGEERIKEESKEDAALPPLENETDSLSTEKKEKEKSSAKKEKDPDLIYPFSSENFKTIWAAFMEMPKQKKKPHTSRQMMLKNLSEFDEDFAIKQIELAIQNNWQGLTFSDTKEKYLQSKKRIINYGSKQSTNQQKRDELDALADLAGQVVSAIESTRY